MSFSELDLHGGRLDLGLQNTGDRALADVRDGKTQLSGHAETVSDGQALRLLGCTSAEICDRSTNGLSILRYTAQNHGDLIHEKSFPSSELGSPTALPVSKRRSNAQDEHSRVLKEGTHSEPKESLDVLGIDQPNSSGNENSAVSSALIVSSDLRYSPPRSPWQATCDDSTEDSDDTDVGLQKNSKSNNQTSPKTSCDVHERPGRISRHNTQCDSESSAEDDEHDLLESLEAHNLPSPPRRSIDRELHEGLCRLLGSEKDVKTSRNIPDSAFDEVSNLLLEAGLEQWSLRPRTFTALWIIKAPALLEDFIQAETWDIALPYTFHSLPKTLSPSQRRHFMKHQGLVLTKAARMEGGSESKHAYLERSADYYFDSLKSIGKGGSGSVDCVRSKLSRKVFARKTMKRSTIFDQDQRALAVFHKEIGHMRRLEHHHLVRYVGSYTDPTHVGIIMAPVAEYDLHTFLSRPSLRDADRTCIRQFFGCLCAAVVYLQNQCIRHKDIKPENILVKNFRVYITDFGLARDWTNKGRSTTQGVVDGHTYPYAAPEVLEQNPRNSSSDIWSLGCVYLDMLTVLKGETLVEKQRFFENNGTLGNSLCKNPEAYRAWIQKLQSTFDSHPLEWVTNMIRWKPKARLTAQMLMARILDCDDEKCYYGNCCDSADEDGLSPKPDNNESSSSDADTELEVISERKTKDPKLIEKRLCQAAKLGDITAVGRWLRQASKLLKAEGRSPSSFRTQAIFEATRTGNGEVLEKLINFGCDLEVRREGYTPLISAVSQSHEDVAELLIRNKANIDAQDPAKCCSALQLATTRNLRGVLGTLLANRADVNILNRAGLSPLMLAIDKRNEWVVKTLLDHKADAIIQNKRGFTAVHLAASIGYFTGVQFLLDHDPQSIDRQYAPAHKTVLYVAAECNQPAIVNLLLERGANPNVRQEGGDRGTALHVASSKGLTKMVQTLLDKKSDTEIRCKCDDTALSMAVGSQKKDVVKLLLKHGADPNMLIRKFTSLLFLALNKANLEIAQLLIDHGVNIEHRSVAGWTALHRTADGESEDLLYLLLDHGAKINSRNRANHTPLMVAAKNGRLMSVGILLERGANPKLTVAASGATALHLAAEEGTCETVSLLLAYGADARRKNSSGETAGMMAQEFQNDDALKLLQKAEQELEFGHEYTGQAIL